jgi:hypothetical protein
MSRTIKYNDKYQKRDARPRDRRRISARAVRREDPDLRRMGRALIEFALAEADAEAQARKRGKDPASKPDGNTPPEAKPRG